MLRAVWVRLRGLMGDVDSVDEEVRLHFEREMDRNIARGMAPDLARAQARRAFGNPMGHQEAAREAWRWRWVEQLAQDLRYAIRVLRRDRVFSVTTVLSLGIGIGAVATVYGVAHQVLLRPLPVPHPEQLVTLSEQYPGRTRDQFPYDMYKALRDAPGLFTALAAVNVFDRSNISLSGPHGRTSDERARVAIVSGNYFQTMGVSAAIGRTLTSDDDDGALGAHPVAVISDRYWRTRAGRSRDVLAATITLNGTAFRVVGVMPKAFVGDWIGRPVDIWVPFAMHQQVLVEVPAPLLKRNDSFLRLVGRLPAGSSLPAFGPAAHAVYQRTMLEWLGHAPGDDDRRRLAQWRLELRADSRGYLPQRDDLTPNLRVLGLIVLLALIIAGANAVGLLLARSAARTRELCVRRAIGAGTARLARQLLVEGFVLATCGGVIGIALAAWGTTALARSLASGPVLMFWGASSWIAFDAGLDASTIALTIGICLLTALVLGLAPLLIIRSRAAIAPALGARSPVSERAGPRLPLGKALVVGQLALSLVVVVTAGLFMRTLMNLRATPLGFDRDGVLLVWTQPSGVAHTPTELRNVWWAVMERLRALPGVAAVGASNGGLLTGSVPTNGMSGNPMLVPGQPPRPTTISSVRSFVTPGFFGAMGMSLLAGRDFTEADADTLRRVVILNQTLARHYFAEGDAVGRMVAFSPDTVANTRIVGVVADAVEGTPRAVGARQMRTFFPYRDRESRRRLDAMMVAVHTRGAPRALATSVREAIREVAPQLPVLEIDTIDEQLDAVLAAERLVARLATIFAAVALLLACVGLYGLIAFMTTRRTSEIGIRIALGASGETILAMVLSDGLKLVGLGILAGIGAAMLSSRLVASRLYGIETGDPATVAVACALLVLVAGAAGFIPARRAAMVDPMTALRCE